MKANHFLQGNGYSIIIFNPPNLISYSLKHFVSAQWLEEYNRFDSANKNPTFKYIQQIRPYRNKSTAQDLSYTRVIAKHVGGNIGLLDSLAQRIKRYFLELRGKSIG